MCIVKPNFINDVESSTNLLLIHPITTQIRMFGCILGLSREVFSTSHVLLGFYFVALKLFFLFHRLTSCVASILFVCSVQ